MGSYLFMLLIILLVQAQLGTAASSDISKDGFCTQEWYRLIGKKVATGDDQGHGPDLGSGEWQSVVEFKLGIRGKVDVPQRNSDAWCRFIDQIVRNSHQGNAENGKTTIAKKGAAPSFSCGSVQPGSV